ncbi:MAG: glycosyltransferase family 2 protein [Candidatus Omnitrophica bacterium]|nr:glycosyltransferase family 2 protein [Candidatus Omnitrophota bacterium]
MKLISSGIPQINNNELLLFVCTRNEVKRIPFFLEYYRLRGVDRFFFIDNDSRDETKEVLLSQKDVCLFQTDEPYSDSLYGINWQQALASKYGRNKWCLLVDMDEFLVYPHCEEVPIKDLCLSLDSEGKNAMKVMLLDMYADGFPSVETRQPLWEVFPYFDKDSHYLSSFHFKEAMFGGVRKRVFGVHACLQKIPLIKYSPAMKLKIGMHRVLNVDLSKVEGILLHFKFDSLFALKANEESQRKQHWKQAVEYNKYLSQIKPGNKFQLYNPTHSVKYKNSQQLVDMRLMKTSGQFESYVRTTLGR